MQLTKSRKPFLSSLNQRRSFYNLRRKPLFESNSKTRTRLYFSSDSNKESNSTSSIIQGPSLLTSTGKYRPSPSLFYLPGLRSLPLWTSNNPISNIKVAYNDPVLTNFVNVLESQYELIKQEYLQCMQDQKLKSDYDVKDEHHAESLHSGTWKWHSYVLKGVTNPLFPIHCPITASIINDEQVKSQCIFQNTPFSFCFFSTLSPQSFIKPHFGPMNLRLRIHLPLICPPPTTSSSPSSKSSGIRVGNQIRTFEEGKALILDDSYEHEVWNESNEHERVTLLIDVWHPDVEMQERERIVQMFKFAQEQGWLRSKKASMNLQ